MIKNNNLVDFSYGGYKTDFCGFHKEVSESKKASKKQF